MNTKLIVGLGNPGKEYEWTRHSIGAHVVREYASGLGWSFKADRQSSAYVARGERHGLQVCLAYLAVYMNESGQAVKKLFKHLNVGVSDTLVVFDDIETKWLDVKVVCSGGTRGHNGIRSMHSHLVSKDFFQLRVGVGHPGGKNVSEYVLSRFNDDEMNEMPLVLERSIEKIDEWLFRSLQLK